MSAPLRLAIVITGLGMGGAEHALLQLLARFDPARVAVTLIVLGRDDALADRFRAAGIAPQFLGLHPGRWPLGEIARFVALLGAAQPDLIQGWMYHGNLAASYAAARLGRPVCWSVRDTPDAAHGHSLFTRLVIRLSGWYVGRVACIFNVSQRSADYCARALGWPAARTEVLPNGIDCQRFRPDPLARNALREALAIPAAAPVLGMVARYAAVKNHALFLQAARVFVTAVPAAQFVLVGKGCEPGNAELEAQIAGLGLKGRVHLLGPRHDVEAIVPGFDLAVLSSRSEGFPNVLAEALACGVPVVSTDVGDAAEIVGDCGRIVAADADSMAAAFAAVLRHDSPALTPAACRERILSRYALETVAERVQQRYEALAAARRA